MYRSAALCLLFILSAHVVSAQLGGKRIFEFLNLPSNSRTAALGGTVVTSTDSDVNMFLSNPALLDSSISNHLSFNHLGFYAGIKYNAFTYAASFKKIGLLGISVQSLGYGDFESFDASGNSIGTFDAGEIAITVSKSHQLGPFALGVNLKYAESRISTYKASALMLDIGGTFVHPERELTIGLNFKSLGVTLGRYTETDEGQLPFDVQFGITFKPEHMPFRFTFTAYNLNRSNASFFDENISLSEDEPGQVDQIFRHINIGTELVLGKNFQLRFGYNHLLRKELRLQNTAGGSGISFGFLMRIKAFELSYTNMTYHADGGKSFITITTNLNRVFKKKTTI